MLGTRDDDYVIRTGFVSYVKYVNDIVWDGS